MKLNQLFELNELIVLVISRQMEAFHNMVEGRGIWGYGYEALTCNKADAGKFPGLGSERNDDNDDTIGACSICCLDCSVAKPYPVNILNGHNSFLCVSAAGHLAYANAAVRSSLDKVDH